MLKKKEFLECQNSSKLSLELEKDSEIEGYCQKFLRFEVGNGEHNHLWLDCWHLAGILLEQFGYRAIYDAQSSLEAKLASVIQNDNWAWRPARSKYFF